MVGLLNQLKLMRRLPMFGVWPIIRGGVKSNSCFSGTISLIKLNFSVSVIGFLMVTSALSRHLRELELRYCNKTRTKLIDIKNVYTGKKSEVVHFSRIPSRSKHAA